MATTLQSFQIPIAEIIASGGGETKGTQRLRHSLTAAGWHKTKFDIQKTINGIVKESQTHEIDHVKNGVALEIEWNNKDPFFDRDLENFKRLHAEGAISVGIIITRGTSMQESMKELVHQYAIDHGITTVEDLTTYGLTPTSRQLKDYAHRAMRVSFPEAWAASFVQDKYGAATTHWRKLQDRMQRGVGNPCPLILVGLPAGIVTFNRSST